jgi:excisionase family DNA binding protein
MSAIKKSYDTNDFYRIGRQNLVHLGICHGPKKLGGLAAEEGSGMLDLGIILTTGDAAKELQVSSDFVRKLAREGRLPALMTRSGQRLFCLDDIEALVRQRAAKQDKRQRRQAGVGAVGR